MSYGIKITNPSSELVLSSDARGLYCIGKGALIAGPTQPTGFAAGTFSNRRRWGTSTYRFYANGPIMAAIDLPDGYAVSVVGITQPAVGVWDVECHAGISPDVDGFYAQVQIDVWAFAFVGATSGGYGAAIFNKDGSLAYDLSRSGLLFPRAFVSVQSAATSFLALSRPVVFGFPYSNQVFDSRLSGANNTYEVQEQRYAWQRSGNSITQIAVSIQKYRYSATEPQGLNNDEFGPAAGFVIEGALLP